MYEKKHRYIEAAEWASENWRDNRFSDLTATNVDKKLALAAESPDSTINKIEEHLIKELESIRRIKSTKGKG